MFSERFYPHGGGAELATWLYSKLLAEEGFEITVVTTQFPGEARQDVVCNGLRIYRLPARFMLDNRYHTLANVGVLATSFINNLIEQSDVVYVPCGWYSAIPAAKLHNKPVVVHMHNYSVACSTSLMFDFDAQKVKPSSLKSYVLHELIERNREPLSVAASCLMNEFAGKFYYHMARYGDILIFVSQAQMDLVLSAAPSLKSKSCMIYNPIPAFPFIKAEKSGVGYFGGKDFLKGYYVFIKALNELRTQSAVTSYLTMTSKKQRKKRLNNGAVLDFLPKLPQAELCSLMKNLSVAVVPSLWPEPSPYSLVQSMIQGKLVIASDIGGMPEILKGETSGVKLTKPGDYIDIAETLDDFLSLTLDEANEIGLKNREFILNRFNNHRTVSSFVKVLEKCALGKAENPMFPLSYQFFVMFFAVCYAVFFFLKLRNAKALKESSSSKPREILFLGLMLILLVTPWIAYAVLNPQSFRNNDVYTYMSDSQTILRQGNIPAPSLMVENQYYAAFPVFTLLLSFISSITNLTSMQGVYVVNILTQVLFWLAVWLLIRKNSSNIGFQYIFLGVVAATYANPYLYGYFNTPLPQTLSLSILLLLLIATSFQNTKSYSIIYLFLLPIGLIHITTLPLFLLTLIILLISTVLPSRAPTSAVNVQNGLRRLILPAIVFLVYVVYTIAVYPVVDYLQKIGSFMTDLANDALSGQVAVTEGLNRGILYPLNALGPALVIGATLSYLLLYLQATRNHKESNNWLASIAVLSLIFIFIGTLRGQFTVWGDAFFSISRYFNLPGFMLATIITAFVIANLFQQERRKSFLLLLSVLLALSAIGGLLDPLVF